MGRVLGAQAFPPRPYVQRRIYRALRGRGGKVSPTSESVPSVKGPPAIAHVHALHVHVCA